MADALQQNEERAAAVRDAASSRGPLLPDRLTTREAEVLAGIAAGKSNREIAAELVISTRTVVHHVEHIYRKIAARNRADAAAYAIRQGLAGGAPSSA